MGLSILSNIPSLEAQNQLSVTNANLQNTLFQLSTGSKINSGADDPAGLSIADGLQANISALTQSAQNVTDGVGMLQTADGALSQVTSLLNTAVTLATEAGNTGLTNDQQTALNNEFNSITAEINQIGQNTTYNNTAVFTGANTSVFLSDGSAIDAGSASGPTISVAMPTLSASQLAIGGTYATGTLDLTGQPVAGNTVTIGTQIYTFENSGDATAANQVALGGSVQATLQNLQAAVNGAPGAGTTYGTGTTANTSAQITTVTGGSAQVQALAEGTAGNTVALSAMLSSTAGGAVAPMTGGAAVKDATGTLSLANNPTVLTNASGTLTLTGAPTAGDTVAVGGNTYTFVAHGDASAAGDVSLDANGNITNTLTNLADAITGGGSSGVNTYFAGQTTAGVTAAVNGDALTVTSTTAGTAGNTTTAFSASISHSNGAVTNVGGGADLGGGAAADTVTVGNTIYTFVAAGDATAADEVAVGSTVNATLTNLQGAVNTGTGGSANTYFSSAGPNGAATIAVNGNTATVTAVTQAGNSQPAVAFSATGSISGSVAGTNSGNLSGGANAAAASANMTFDTLPSAGNTLELAGQTYTFVAAGGATAANEVALGTGSSANAIMLATLTNLENAVNGTGTPGDGTYGANTGVNADVEITNPASNAGVGTFTVQALLGGTAGNAFTIDANLNNAIGGVVGSGMSGGVATQSLMSATSAQSALTAIESAIATVASYRGTIGSGINQMNAAVQVMNNTSQNLSSSLSGIQDANMGQVVANMSKYQVLEQTGIAALAQSNQNEQSVLKLLQ